jgi:hypothetical protein
VLTATMGRPEESTVQVIAVQAQMVAAVNGRHVIESDAGHYNRVDRPDLVAKYVRHVAFRRPLTTVFVAAHKAEPRRG